jgi:general stress protein YciG
VRPVTQPAQEREADTEQAQDWEREQEVGEVPGQRVGPTTGKNFEHTAGITGNFDNTAGMTPDEQEGQKVNVEQSHEANSAQYTGKPGTKAPSPGQQSGTAWGQDMELGNENEPARDPDSY